MMEKSFSANVSFDSSFLSEFTDQAHNLETLKDNLEELKNYDEKEPAPTSPRKDGMLDDLIFDPLRDFGSVVRDFRTKAATYSRAAGKKNFSGSRTILEEKKYLLGVLDNKLLSAETRLGDMQTNLDDEKKFEMLSTLMSRLQQAEDKIRGKDDEISELQKALRSR